MTSDFCLSRANDDLGAWVITSNGTAEYLVQCWLRVLESTNPDSSVVPFLRHRVEVGCAGMYGFHLDEDDLAPVDARRLLAFAVERVAHDCLAAIQGASPDESLRFLTTHEPFYQARWLSLQERIHGLVRRSLDDTIPTLRLELDVELRLAVDAMRHDDEIRLLAHARIELPRQLDLRREQCELQCQARKFFDADVRKRALYELADIEEALGFLEAAAATTRKAAELEESAEIAELSREIAASRGKLRAD